MVSAPRCRPGARGFLTLLLLLPLPGARGLCGALPTFSRAVPHDTSRTEGFPIGTKVTYRCRDGFVKIPGQSDTLVCLSNSEWSTIGEFCGPSCGTIPRLKSAVLSKEDEKKNYHAHGTTVSYVCRPGYERTELRPVITCLENFTWSEASEFCRGKSCGVPKGPEHGRAVDITNDQYGARVNIICDEGIHVGTYSRNDPTGSLTGRKNPFSKVLDYYRSNWRVRFRLRGRTFIQCMLKGDQVEWSQLPTCEVIITQDKPTTVPPKGTEVAGTSSDSALDTIGNSTELEDSALDTIDNSTELEDSALDTIDNFTELEVIITQDKPTTVPPKGTEVAGTSSDVITQDKPTTVPLEGAEVTGTSSGSALNTAGNSAEPEDEEPGILTRITNFIGIGPCIDKCIGIGIGIGIIIGVACFVIVASLIIQCQKKKSSYSVNPDSPKCQITT